MRHDVLTDISGSTLQHDLQFIELVKSTEVLPCLKNGIFCKLFLLTAIKDPKSTFTLIKERAQTERGRQGENYSFDEKNMRRDLDVMGRVT